MIAAAYTVILSCRVLRWSCWRSPTMTLVRGPARPDRDATAIYQDYRAGIHDSRSHSRTRPLGPLAHQFGAGKERRHPVRRRPHAHARERRRLLSLEGPALRRDL